MKHSVPETARLISLCRDSGMEVTEEAADLLISYLHAVLDANMRVNLTRITAVDEALRLHLLDSLCAIPEVNRAPSGPLCDIGTGAGFPGVPISLATGRDCTLLDSVRKKADVVKGLLDQLGISDGIQVSYERAEQHARTHFGQYSAVTARAVAPLASLVELASPLLSSGGVLIALKGAPTSEEVDSGRAAARLVGLEEVARRDYMLAGGSELRCVITYAKSGKSTLRLPRREGLAQHSPLG